MSININNINAQNFFQKVSVATFVKVFPTLVLLLKMLIHCVNIIWKVYKIFCLISVADREPYLKNYCETQLPYGQYNITIDKIYFDVGE